MDTEIHLSLEEVELLQKFRQLSSEGRQFILCTTKDAYLLHPKVARYSNVLPFLPAIAV